MSADGAPTHFSNVVRDALNDKLGDVDRSSDLLVALTSPHQTYVCRDILRTLCMLRKFVTYVI
jgi:hypothetical protein